VRRKDHLAQASELERVNAELRQSLEHCRELVAECRSKLTANSNGIVAEAGPHQAGQAQATKS